MPFLSFFLLLPGISYASCPPADLGVSLTACGFNHTRHAAFYWREPCASELPPAPMWDLDCDLPCPAGTFLDVDRAKGTSACSKCPSGTYNIGGGEMISGVDGDWTKQRSRYSAYCWTTLWMEWKEGQGCTPWTPGANGEAVYAGTVTRPNTWMTTDLVYYAKLVRKGSLKVRYSKVSRMLSSFQNGILKILVNNRQVYFDDSLQNHHPQTFSLDLPPGPTEITISFEKYSTKGQEDVSAKVTLLEVRGTTFNSHFCFPCLEGISEEGADHCEPCPADYYLTILGRCEACGADQYSPQGSTSKEDCLLRKPCTDEDYSRVYSPCHSDSTRNVTYIWHLPFICDSSTGVELPPAELGLPCDVCNPGEYHAKTELGSSETVCRPCPPGTALTESKVEIQCTRCKAGTYTMKLWNVTSWNTLPDSFSTACIPRDGEECETQQGWVPRGTNIWTGSRPDHSCKVTLSRLVNITEENAAVHFQLSMDLKASGGNLTFEIDSQLIADYTSNQKLMITSPVHLERGIRMLRWTYHRESSADSPTDAAVIYWIAISGLSEGGSPMCSSCPPGHYSSAGSQSCEPCPAGFTHNSDQQGCDLCPAGTISDTPGNGKGCAYCPANTQPTEDHTRCIGQPVVLWVNKTYAISKLTGIQGNSPLYTSGICTENDRVKLFCTGNFYGPIPDNSFNEYYLSVVNPGDLSFHKYTKFDSTVVAYAWGVLNKTNLPSVKEQDLNLPDDACIADFSKLQVNLGSKVGVLTGTSKGFSVKYTDGSLCSKNSLDRFSTEISFECEKAEGDGWPVFSRSEACTAHFLWRTKYACEVCVLDKLHKLKGQCKDGRRTVQALETSACYYPGAAEGLIWEEDCSTAKDLVMSWQGLIGVIALCCLSLAALVLFVCFCKVKKQYQLLRDEGDQPRGVELT